MQIIKNLLSNQELDFVLNENKKFSWSFSQGSEIHLSTFWIKHLELSKNKDFFETKIKNNIKKNIVIDYIYCNGQALGQCGFWHKDIDEKIQNKFTLVYFYQHWLPEYGGHFLANINNEIISILPEFNKGILFDSTFLHMALSPSIHCPIQRESLAVKFTIL